MVLNESLFWILLSVTFETEGREIKSHGFGIFIFHILILPNRGFKGFWNSLPNAVKPGIFFDLYLLPRLLSKGVEILCYSRTIDHFLLQKKKFLHKIGKQNVFAFELHVKLRFIFWIRHKWQKVDEWIQLDWKPKPFSW